MEYEYQDSYRADVANKALVTIYELLQVTDKEPLTHRQRNSIDETIRIIIRAATRESAKTRNADPTGIPF